MKKSSWPKNQVNMLPFFELFGQRVYSYPLLMGIAWGISFHLFRYILSLKKMSFKYSKLFFTGVFVISWIGAKLFFVLTSQGINEAKVLANSNFWLGGGFVFYGGLVFGILFVLIFKMLTKSPWSHFNVLIPPLALGHGIGRIGCLLAGCCYGKVWPYGVFMHNHHRYPVQLMEAAGLFLIAFITFKLLKSGKKIILFYIFSYGVLRFILEFIRGDEIRGIWAFGLSTSQLVALSFILLAAVLYFLGLKLDKSRAASS